MPKVRGFECLRQTYLSCIQSCHNVEISDHLWRQRPTTREGTFLKGQVNSPRQFYLTKQPKIQTLGVWSPLVHGKAGGQWSVKIVSSTTSPWHGPLRVLRSHLMYYLSFLYKLFVFVFLLLNCWSSLLSKDDFTSEYLSAEHFQVKRPLIKYFVFQSHQTYLVLFDIIV